MQQNSPPQRQTSAIQNAVFAIILVLLFLFVCKLFSPFWTVLLWSSVLYIIVSPLHNKVTKKLNFKGIQGVVIKNIIAMSFALAIAVLILLPVLFVSTQFITQIISLLRDARDYLLSKPDELTSFFNKAAHFISDMTSGQIVLDISDAQAQINSFLSTSLQTLIRYSTHLARNVGAFIAGLAFMVFCLYFFFLDAKYLITLFTNIPIKKEYIHILINKFKTSAKNLLLGYMMVGAVQAVLAFIVYTAFGVKGAFVFACLTFICVYIPILGGALVWLPIGIARIITHGISSGILFLAVSAVVISLLDNILRPYFLEDRIKLHPLIIFLSILGGVANFGFNGIGIGPLVVIFFLTVLEIFLTEHELDHTETTFTT
ncbi:MAG: AI-2E family transporter [Spirochaetaceae bacterium]|jgi:predicted PurR-regulated permease PerM|nr:AI-2E family transporter [Spirochaetaceae bacterium]